MTLTRLGLLYQASICFCYIANLAPLTLPYCMMRYSSDSQARLLPLKGTKSV